jgi:hypothetical protein
LVWKLISTKKGFAKETLAHANTSQMLVKSNARINDLERIGSGMFLELQSRAYEAEYRWHIVACLESKLSDLAARAAAMDAKRLAEEKKAVGVSIVELLLAFFFPAKCRHASSA